MMSPLVEADASKILLNGSRKALPTGTNRSWSQDENEYLLQSRAQKVPYKYIAEHLKKTELACRLHFHQLSHTNHRRRRASSVSSIRSSHSGATHSSRSSPRSLYQHSSDGDMADLSRYSPLNYSQLDNSHSYASHKMLLPKPTSMARAYQHEVNFATRPQVSPSVGLSSLPSTHSRHRSTGWTTAGQGYASDTSLALHDVMYQTQPVSSTRLATPSYTTSRAHPSYQLFGLDRFNSYSGTNNPSTFGGVNYASASAVDANNQMEYFTPRSCVSQERHPGLSRHSSWGCATSSRAPTTISALLTDNKCPLGSA